MAFENTANSSVRETIDQGRAAADHVSQAAKDGYQAAQQYAKGIGLDFDLLGVDPLPMTPAQMKALAAATGPAFDHLFLTGMIQHHTGALTMVKDLFATQGAGQDPQLFDFASDVDNTQQAEIDIMRHMLKEKQ